MLRHILKLGSTAFITGIFAALAATVYGLLVSQVAPDESAAQRARMVHLLAEISGKLDGGSMSSGFSTRSLDDLKPIDVEVLTLGNDNLQYYQRAAFIGPKLYKTSIFLSHLSESGLEEENFDRIEWTFDGNAVGTTWGSQPLFLSKIKKPLFSKFASKKSFDVTAQVWLNDEVAKDEGISNPIELKTEVEW